MNHRAILVGVSLVALLLAAALVWLFFVQGAGPDSGAGGEDARRVGSDAAGGAAPGAGGGLEGGGKGAPRGEGKGAPERRLNGERGPAGAEPDAAAPLGAEGAGRAGAVDGGARTPEEAAEEAEAERLRAIRCTVTGTVKVLGTPRSGVALTLASWIGPKWNQAAVTGAGGTYSFSEVRYGPWSVATTQARLFGKGVKVECDEDGQALTADLELSAADVRVLGRVTDRDGNPLDRTVVEIERQTSHQALDEMIRPPVSPDGRFEVWLPRDAQDYSATAEAPGHVGEAKGIPTDRDQVELVFRLRRESLIHGVVLGPDGPRAGCEVHVQHENPGGSVTLTSMEADAQGQFSIPTGPGKVTLGAWDREVGWAHADLPARQETDDVHDVVLRLQPGKTITGVIELQSGKPVPMGRVHFYCEPTPISEVVQADLQGVFTLPNLPPADKVHLQAWDDARPWAERGLVLEPGQTEAEVILVPAPDGQEAP
jgi:hypothetical protein